MIAALSAWHEHHEAAAEAIADVTAIPAHVALEAYSVLTRLPGGLAVPATSAASVVAQRFDQPPLRLGEEARSVVLETLAGAGVYGGSSYDGLVALEAKAHEQVLLTLDDRALPTYQRLGVAYRVIAR